MNKNAKRIAIGTMVAGVMGYIAGILTAPKSGAETRGQIRDMRDTGINEAEKQLKRLHTELNQLIGEATAKGKQAVADGKPKVAALQTEVLDTATRARQKAREILSALHDGQADDKDLDKAISEASKAVKSIRKYLQK